jgi:DNA-directed RNA polymerase sigma subunit (sigma70/sigma32)
MKMSEYKFKTCIEACKTLEESCPNNDCRNWIDFEEDLNCTHIAVEKHGSMTLREISKRVGCSFVRVKQIEEEVLEKIKDRMSESNYL